MGATLRRNINVFESVPTVSSGVAYTAQDQVGGIQTIANVFTGSGSGRVVQIVVSDASAQSAALNFLFFDALPVVASVDNGALDITDAEMADKCVGSVTLAAANYITLSGNTLGTIRDLNLVVKNDKNSTRSLYVVCSTTGTPTYTSTTALAIRYSIELG